MLEPAPDELVQGAFLVCLACGAELELVRLKPPRLRSLADGDEPEDGAGPASARGRT